MSTSSSKSRVREKRAPRSNEQEKLKTVVRRLPANLPEDVFWQSVQNWVSDDTISWKVYYPGKLRKRLNKENVPSRAYMAFKTEEQLAVFSQEYDGHVFRDKAGNESQAVVEFAPYQKVPSDRKKQDARVGTIDKDEDYVSFLASLQEEPSRSTDLDALELLAPSAQPPLEQKITPLLEALIAQKAAAKDKANQPPPTILAAKRDGKKAAAAGTSMLNTNLKAGHITSQKGDKTSGVSVVAGKAAKAGNPSSKDGSTPKNGALGSSSKASLPAKAQDTHTGGKKGGKRSAKAGAEPSQSTSTTSTAGPSSPPKHLSIKPKRERPSRSTAELGPTTGPTLVAEASVTSTSAGSSATLNGEAPPARRVRPVIGLASRQFEAALGGAGIRARQARSNPDASNSTSASASAGQAQPQGEAIGSSAPASGRRGGRGGGGRTSPTVNRNSSAAIIPSTTILQRIDDPGAELPPTTPAGSGGAEDANASSRGGRRGRGRGRGGSTPRGG